MNNLLSKLTFDVLIFPALPDEGARMGQRD